MMNKITPHVSVLKPGCLRSQAIVLVLVASLLVAIPRQAQACGPFFTDAIFVYTRHPDFPLKRFAGGQLGVLQPSYARSYLFVAYRNLTGVGFSSAAEKALESLWEDRLNNSWQPHDEEWIKKWLDARSQVADDGVAPEIRVYRDREKPHEYETFLNCQQDAFENAAATLGERIKRFGAGSAEARDWVVAQDTVFSNCGGGQHLPPPEPAGADALLRADRAYQTAAAHFYAGNFDQAKQQFDLIARDQNSPWQAKAPYLAARALVRKASMAEKDEDSRTALVDAETRLKTILADEKLGSVSQAAGRLLNLVRVRLYPEAKLHELAQTLVTKNESGDFKQDVWDYTHLLDKVIGEDTEEAAKKTIPPNLKADEVSDWILTFQDRSVAGRSHSLERWGKNHSLVWLVAAMSKATPGDAATEVLLAEAAKADRTSPAFATIAFHRVRLLMESNRTDEARTLLDQIIASDGSRLPPSALNLLLNQRLMLARNLEGFLRSAPRVPAGFSDNEDGRELPAEESQVKEITKGAILFFDVDAANIFNKAAPLDVLKVTALDRTLAVNLRRDVTQAAFVRAALLGSEPEAGQLAPVLESFYPQLRELLGVYQNASPGDAKRFAAVYLSLQFPGLRPYVTSGVGRSTPPGEIDNYRDNWWCAETPIPRSGPPWEDVDKLASKPVNPPEFLKGSQAVAAKQLATLQALGTGPNYLCRAVIDWAEQHPADPRVPEALHLAVKSTRYGCTDQETGRWSKAAFDLLHRRYPNSTWAKQTKYWFKG